MFLFPNYLENKSLIVLQNHHALIDGIGSNIILAKMADNYSTDTIPPLKPFSKWMLVEKFFLSIFYIKQFLKTQFEIPEGDGVSKNPIRQKLQRSEVANCTIGETYSLKEIKEKGRKFGLTFNDLMLACHNKAIRLYFHAK